MRIEYTVCDFCKSHNPKYKKINLPIKTKCDWTEGRPALEHIEFMQVDICEECLIKTTNVIADFQGSNLQIIGE